MHRSAQDSAPLFSRLIGPAIAGSLYFAVAASTIYLTRGSHGIATVWPANAVLLAMVLRRERASWWPVLLAGFIGNALANLVTRGTIDAPLLFGIANIVEVIVAAWGMDRRGPAQRIFHSPAGVWHFILWAGLIAPAVSGLLGATTATALYGGDFPPAFAAWFVADALGLLIVTPFLLALFRGDYLAGFREQTTTQRLEAAALLTLTGIVTTAVFHARFPLLFLISMPLMLVTFRLGWLGTKLAVVIVAVIGAVSTLMQAGPIARLVADPDLQFGYFQFFLAALLMINMPVAAALEASKELMNKLKESEGSFRLLAAQSPTLLLQFDRDGVCRKALGAGEVLIDEGSESLIGKRVDALSGDHAEALRAAHGRALTERDAMASVEFSPAGLSERWFEATFCALLDERGQCTGTLASVHNVTARKRQATALARSAMTDSLTGLLNRAGFMHRLDKALAMKPGCTLALAMIDVDRFKLINDNAGHFNGDIVLREVAARVAREVRGGDAVARLGGDEFVILLDASGSVEPEDICRRVVSAVAGAPIHLPSGASLRAAISCGVARHAPGQSAEHFLEAADIALYEAKRAGRNRVVAA
jgi:diguanylate cyclase (GGDEF)-like protein